MNETDRGRIGDILEAIGRIRGYCRGMSESRFLLEPQTQDAVIRRLTIIGEAAAKLSAAVRRIYGDVPWEAMIGMRHILVHDYGRSNMTTIWQTVENDLPAVEKILRKPSGSDS